MATVGKHPSGVRSRRWTKPEYYRLAELGFFQGQRVELIEGKIVVLSPQGPSHYFVVDRAHRLLSGLLSGNCWVRMQAPVDFGQTTEPEPDVSVVPGVPEDYRNFHPTTGLLIVEVSDSSLSYDRGRKGSLYARAGVTDYWIVNLVNQQVEVYRDPIPDASQPYGYRYASRHDLQPGGNVDPLSFPGLQVAVNDLLGTSP
jgi:Uma2 family endonuclease